MDDETVTQMHKEAQTVAVDHRDYTMALDKERQAQADFLDALRAAVRPALPAISSRVVGFRAEEIRGVELSGAPPRLLLLEDGDFAILEANDRGQMVLKHPVHSAEVVSRWKLQGVERTVGRLRELLEEQSRGRKRVAADRCHRMAAKLHAVATLLRGR